MNVVLSLIVLIQISLSNNYEQVLKAKNKEISFKSLVDNFDIKHLGVKSFYRDLIHSSNSKNNPEEVVSYLVDNLLRRGGEKELEVFTQLAKVSDGWVSEYIAGALTETCMKNCSRCLDILNAEKDSTVLLSFLVFDVEDKFLKSDLNKTCLKAEKIQQTIKSIIKNSKN